MRKGLFDRRIGGMGATVIFFFCAIFCAAVPRTAAAQAFDSVVCRGNEALVRFSNVAPIVGAAITALLPDDPSTCRLRDGRRVRFKQYSIGGEKAYGRCGADSTMVFSLWVGEKKLYGHETYRPKCGAPSSIESVWLHGDTLTECRTIGGMDEESSKFKCHDESARIRNPQEDEGEPGALKLIRNQPGRESFCRSFIIARRSQTPRDFSGWQTYAEGYVEEIENNKDYPTEELGTRTVWLDLQNIGAPTRTLYVTGYSGPFDGSFFVVVPDNMTEADAGKLAKALGSNTQNNLRDFANLKIYDGWHTAFHDTSFTWMNPIIKDGKVWLHAQRAAPTLGRMSDIILEPSISGMTEICAFRSVPLL